MSTDNNGWSEAHLAASVPKPRMREVISTVDRLITRLNSSLTVTAIVNNGQYNQELMRELVVLEHVLQRLIDISKGY